MEENLKTEHLPDNNRLYANWDAYWDGFMSNHFIETLRFSLIRRACDRLLRPFEPASGMKFCELGAGQGVMSRYLGQKYQADVSLVDNNARALAMCKETFQDFSGQVEIIDRDVFDLSEFSYQYDLVISGGLIEHFINDAREGIIKAHCDLVKDKGYVLILVPVHNLWYSILNYGVFKWLHLLDEIKEVPWSYDELSEHLQKYGFKIIAQTYVISEMGILAQKS